MGDRASQKIVCPVCESTSYELRNGTYFCTLCQTQSQELGMETVIDDEQLFNLGMKTTSISISGRSKSGMKRSEKKELRYSTAELFSCILKQWIKDLETVGICGIGPTVLQLWANYLRKLGYAFIDTRYLPEDDDASDNGAEHIDVSRMTRRDQWYYFQGPAKVFDMIQVASAIKFGRDAREKRLVASTASELDSDNDEPMGELEFRRREKKRRASKKKFYKSLSDLSSGSEKLDSSSAGAPSDVNYDSDSGDSLWSEETGKTDYTRVSQFNSHLKEITNRSSRRLTLENARAILVISATCTPESDVTISDMAYLLGSDTVSYQSSIRALPRDIYLTAIERQIFSGSAPNLKFIYESDLSREAFGVIRHMGIREPLVLTTVKTSRFILKRFLDELCLPSFLLEDVMKTFGPAHLLTLTLGVSKQATELPSVSVRILALLLIALKYHCGLDDVQEYHLSHSAHKLNAINAEAGNVSYFDIMTWIRLSKLRLDYLMAHFPYLRCQYRTLSCVGVPDPTLSCVEETRLLIQSASQPTRGPTTPLEDFAGVTDLLSEFVCQTIPVHTPVKSLNILQEKTSSMLNELKSSLVKDKIMKLESLKDSSMELYYNSDQLMQQYLEGEMEMVPLEQNLLVVEGHKKLSRNQATVFSDSPYMEPSGFTRPARDSGGPAAGIEKRYWFSALPSKLLKFKSDDALLDNILEILPDNYVWILEYFSAFASVKPTVLEAEVSSIEEYILSIDQHFFVMEKT